MLWFKYHFKSFMKDEAATSTLEFIIVLPVIITIFVAVFETGYIMSRQALMERALHETVRVMRLATGFGLELQVSDIEETICLNTSAIQNCDEVLVVDVSVINTVTYDVSEPGISCVERQPNSIIIRPDDNDFRQGNSNDLLLIRACAVLDLILPFSGFGLNLVRDDSGGLHMVAASIFVNEPAPDDR